MQQPDSSKPILQMTAKRCKHVNQIHFPEFWLATNFRSSIISKSHSLQGEWEVLIHIELQVMKNHRTNFHRKKPQTYSEMKKCPLAFSYLVLIPSWGTGTSMEHLTTLVHIRDICKKTFVHLFIHLVSRHSAVTGIAPETGSRAA